MDWSFWRDIEGRRLCLLVTPWAWTSSIHWHVWFMLGCQNLGALSVKGMLFPKWHLRLVVSFLCFYFIFGSVFGNFAFLVEMFVHTRCVTSLSFFHVFDPKFKTFLSHFHFWTQILLPWNLILFGYLSSEIGVVHVHIFVAAV